MMIKAFHRYFWLKNKTGLSVIELLGAITVLVIAFVSILGLLAFSLRVSTFQKQMTQAVALAQEAMEATRNFRDGIAWDHDDADNSYDGISLRTMDTQSYHPAKSGDVPPRWQLVAGEETINDFKRKIVFSKACRDANNNISACGTEDLDTRKVTVTVSWTVRANTYQVVIPMYLANWK